MTTRQGLASGLLGYRTRNTSSGGSRMGFWFGILTRLLSFHTLLLWSRSHCGVSKGSYRRRRRRRRCRWPTAVGQGFKIREIARRHVVIELPPGTPFVDHRQSPSVRRGTVGCKPCLNQKAWFNANFDWPEIQDVNKELSSLVVLGDPLGGPDTLRCLRDWRAWIARVLVLQFIFTLCPRPHLYPSTLDFWFNIWPAPSSFCFLDPSGRRVLKMSGSPSGGRDAVSDGKGVWLNQ